jgi:branched-chain amino acid transport system substrate-binding protein
MHQATSLLNHIYCAANRAVSTATLTLALGPAVLSGGARAEIIVGQSIARTGPVAAQGEATIKGILAYVSRINRNGGVKGDTLVLKTLDGGGDDKRALADVRQLADEAVVALFGMMEGGPCKTLIPYASDAKVPLVACMAGAAPLRTPCMRYVFPLRAGHADELEVLPSAATRLGYKKNAFIHSDTETGRLNLSNLIRAAVARDMVFTLPLIASSKTDISALVDQIIVSEPDIVVNHGSDSLFAPAIRETRSRSNRPMFYVVRSGGGEMARLAGPAYKRVTMSQIALFPKSRSTAIQRAYQDNLKSLYSNELYGRSSIEGYRSAAVLVEALRRAKTPVTRQGLVTSFESLRPLDPGGYSVHYTPTEHAGSQIVDATMIVDGGEFVR